MVLVNKNLDTEDFGRKVKRFHSSITDKDDLTSVDLDTLYEFQYDMEEEIINEQLAITFVALLYSEGKLTQWNPPPKRSARIFLDMVRGIPVKEIERKYKISGTRIREIYHKVLWKLRCMVPHLT